MKAILATADALELRLERAVLIYEDREQAWATVHNIHHGKGRPQIGPGVPADRAAISALAAKLDKAGALCGFLPERLVYLSPRAIAWWRPAQPERVWFECKEVNDKGLIGTRSAITPQPALVFTVAARAWFVHAIDTADRPGPDTQLRRAPCMNVWKSGEICAGNVKLPAQLDASVLADYETAFFGSRFTHANDPGRDLTGYTGGIYALWRDLLDGRHAAFPDGALGAKRGTLAAHLAQLERSRHDR
jgi:PRTRC genetic system protein B